MNSTEITYSDGRTQMVGRVFHDPLLGNVLPGLLLAPAFAGPGPLEMLRASEMAAKGYVVLVVDYYGDGRHTTEREIAFQWMSGLNDERPELARRMNAALDALKALPNVDESRTAAMGFCLGGKAVLDLARSGADTRAVIPIHGLFDAPPQVQDYKAAALILHGWDDPLAQPDDFMALTQELTAHCPDWQTLAFGHTGHSFTNPNAQMPETGMAFSPRADARTWRILTDFLTEQLAE
ncbi:dienelactone hydrolase family protein [Thalassovita sp.]|jgi:dienelactone hydrolase|uniref:dienelactone hydrolase family protein n=1 Tax=Thalassovita sp. TaxID=1979401 RepID=UPI003B5A2B0A